MTTLSRHPTSRATAPSPGPRTFHASTRRRTPTFPVGVKCPSCMTTPPVIHEPLDRAPTAAVVWLHGLGADGHDFAPIVPELGAVREWTRFVFPHAPRAPGLHQLRDDDAGLVRTSATRAAPSSPIRTTCARRSAPSRGSSRTRSGPASPPTGSSSRGSLRAGRSRSRRPCAIPGASPACSPSPPTFPSPTPSPRERSAANAEVPVLMAHGELDPLVGVDRAIASRNTLQRLGYEIEWRTYPMPHAVCPEEIRDIADWLIRVVPDAPPERSPSSSP